MIHCDVNILASQCDSTAFKNVYLPCDRRSIASFTSFAKCCSSLKSQLESLRLKDLNWVLAGDLNFDIFGASDRSTLLLNHFLADLTSQIRASRLRIFITEAVLNGT